MAWKVTKTSKDQIIKAGFQTKEAAEDWLDAASHIDGTECNIAEMDEYEEEEYMEAMEENSLETDYSAIDFGSEATQSYTDDDDDIITESSMDSNLSDDVDFLNELNDGYAFEED